MPIWTCCAGIARAKSGSAVERGRRWVGTARLLLPHPAGILDAAMRKIILAAACVSLLFAANCVARQDVAGDANRLELQGQFKQAASLLTTAQIGRASCRER